MAKIGDIFKPGDKVPHSGIYTVLHDTTHAQPHEVTCIFNKVFPPCRGCSSPRFRLDKAAIHIDDAKQLKEQ